MRVVCKLMHESLNRMVRVAFDSDLSEYVCQLIIDGRHYEPADYFTDDRSEAIGTARAMLAHEQTA